MKKTNSDFSIKNSIMIFVSALVLVAASFCWFSLSSKNDVNEFTAEVDTLSSDFVFYEAVDADMSGTINGQETYVEISDASINTANMVPGQTFFYKFVLRNKNAGSDFAFVFSDIIDANNLSSQVMVTASLYNSSSVLQAETDSARSIAYYSTTQNNVTSANILETDNLALGYYELYYTVKLNNNATSSFENKALTITNVLIAFYES